MSTHNICFLGEIRDLSVFLGRKKSSLFRTIFSYFSVKATTVSLLIDGLWGCFKERICFICE